MVEPQTDMGIAQRAVIYFLASIGVAVFFVVVTFLILAGFAAMEAMP